MAAMRNWHDFAVAVLAYLPEESFPHESEADATAWVTTFHNDGTALNYVSCLKFVCTTC